MLEKLADNLNFKTFGFTVLFLAIIFYSLLSSEIDIAKFLNDVPVEEINSYFAVINDNYTVSVDIKKKDETINYTYQTDGKIDGYEYDGKGYFDYNNKFYQVDEKDFNKINRVDNIPYYKDKYIDIKFIKNLIKHCEFEYVTNEHSDCELTLDNYVKEYNEYYNETVPTMDEKVKIEIYYNSEGINYLVMDYSFLGGFLNGVDENSSAEDYKLIYNMRFSNINNNDFKDIIEFYKDKMK